MTDIEFDNNSTIQFLDEDDSIRSFYVAEEDYQNLKNEMDFIVSKFQP